MAFGYIDDKQDGEFDLYLTRGDSCVFGVHITGDYEYTEGDTLTFSLVAKIGDTPIITKTIPANQAFYIEPADTMLEVGKYIYDVQLDTANGLRFTVITPAVLEITEEVTLNGDS